LPTEPREADARNCCSNRFLPTSFQLFQKLDHVLIKPENATYCALSKVVVSQTVDNRRFVCSQPPPGARPSKCCNEMKHIYFVRPLRGYWLHRWPRVAREGPGPRWVANHSLSPLNLPFLLGASDWPVL
jgi:hypothetical protein